MSWKLLYNQVDWGIFQ